LPTLHSQAHWLVIQKANPQAKPSKKLAYPNAQQTEKSVAI